MIRRVMQAQVLPAHSITIDELGGICKTLIERFGNEEETECAITLIAKNGAFGFVNVEDMIRNKSNIKYDIQKYSVELESRQSKNGLQKVKIIPAFSDNPLQLKSSITAFSGNEGWCADIIATASTEFGRYKVKLNWVYSHFVAIPAIFIAGIIAGSLTAENEVETYITCTAFVHPYLGDPGRVDSR